MKINLGCGNLILKGYVNHDIVKHRPEIDIAFDLNEKEWQKWNMGLEEIRAYDVLEHLNDPLNFMNNCWRWLKKGGVLDLKVCGWKNPNFYVDITHKKAYDIRSFDYFSPDTELGKEYDYYTSYKWRYLDGYPRYDRHMNILVKMTPVK